MEIDMQWQESFPQNWEHKSLVYYIAFNIKIPLNWN